MILNKAKKNDLHFLYEIYNNNVSKGFFTNTKKLKLSEHKNWFYSQYLKKKINFYLHCKVKKKKDRLRSL